MTDYVVEAPVASFVALGKLEQWLAAGGEQQAALPPGSLADLQSATRRFKGRVVGLQSDLSAIREQWAQLDVPDPACDGLRDPDCSTRDRVNHLIGDLARVDQATSEMIGEAAEDRVKVEEARSLVRTYIEEDRQAIAAGEIQLQAARQRMDQAYADLEDAKAQLSGEQGVLNGFLTGISFGIYNPLQENLDKARAAVARYNDEFNTINAQIAAIQRHQSELEAGHEAIEALITLDEAFTGYQNTLTNAHTILSEAYANETHARDAATEGAASYYRRRAGSEMEQLLAWIDIFQATGS